MSGKGKLIIVCVACALLVGGILVLSLGKGKTETGREGSRPKKTVLKRADARGGTEFSEAVARLAGARGKGPGLAMPATGLTPEQQQSLAREQALVPRTPEAAIAQAEEHLRDIEQRLGSPASDKERTDLKRQKMLVERILEKLRDMR
ncbi:MAG: hypothetical protein PHU25_04715 [Deltaproteobacteria bacterium]|nr:hypothetical protein [Deltaproteobacteria bacterium]